MRLELDAMRLVVLNAADTMDLLGNKAGKRVIAQAKILIPNTVQRIIDECCQMYGGQGLTQHTPLPVSNRSAYDLAQSATNRNVGNVDICEMG
jgi:acyl-CoA dehydrogenase